MNKTRIKFFCQKLRQIMLSLKNLVFKTLSTKTGKTGFAVVLVLVLILVFATSGSKEPMGEVSDAVTETQMEEIELTTESVVMETQPVGIPATMGTIIADYLSICKEADGDIDTDVYYTKNDRVEIHYEKTVNGKIWGYTGKGWIEMRFVRMDDVPPGRNDSTNHDGTEIISNGSYAVLGYGVVDLNTLNVRVGPDTNYTKIREIPKGMRYAYYEVADDWVRIGDGWVSTVYFYVEGATAEDATNGIVTTNDLNIRTGPDTSFKRVGSYMEDQSVRILAVVDGWGYTEKGWISMMYVKMPEPVYATGSATVTVGLNIREEPDADAQKVDVYKKGDRITIVEVKDGWGRTDKGWISLDYVQYDQ